MERCSSRMMFSTFDMFFSSLPADRVDPGPSVSSLPRLRIGGLIHVKMGATPPPHTWPLEEIDHEFTALRPGSGRGGGRRPLVVLVLARTGSVRSGQDGFETRAGETLQRQAQGRVRLG